jgi:hypothetical protein
MCLTSTLVLTSKQCRFFFLEKGQHHKINKFIFWAAGFTGHMQLTLLVLELVDGEGHHTVKKVSELPVPIRDVNNQTLPGQE